MQQKQQQQFLLEEIIRTMCLFTACLPCFCRLVAAPHQHQPFLLVMPYVEPANDLAVCDNLAVAVLPTSTLPSGDALF